MKFITGIFKGRYKGKEVEPLTLQTLTSLHFLEVEAGGIMNNCEWVTDYSRTEFTQQFVQVNNIPTIDFHFDQDKFAGQKPFRDNLHTCILLDPQVYNIIRKDNYTYGIIEGRLLGTIGYPLKIEPFNVDESKIIPVSISTLPLNVTTSSDFVFEKPSTWRWRNFLTGLFWVGLFIWGVWWLMSHQGCQPVNRISKHDLPGTDSAVVKKNNDTLMLHPGNMTFSVYDWSIEDHDTVSLFLNGNVIKENLPLTATTVSWVEPSLSATKNILIVKSINDGSIGPASPTIEINDGKNNQVFQVRVYKGKPETLYLILAK